jgi:hypothetical protein
VRLLANLGYEDVLALLAACSIAYVAVTKRRQ